MTTKATTATTATTIDFEVESYKASPLAPLPPFGGLLWRSMGPTRVVDGQTEGVPFGEVSGAVHAIAAMRAGALDVAPLQSYFSPSF